MYLKTKIFSVLFLILAFILGTNDVYGINYFSDNFEQNGMENWDYYLDNSTKESWVVKDGNLFGEIGSDRYSFLIAKSFYDLSDYSINVDAMNNAGVDQDIVFRFKDTHRFYMLNVRFNDQYWPQVLGEIDLWKFDPAFPIGYKQLVNFTDLNKVNLTQNRFHKIRIDSYGSNIKIHFDSILIADIDDTDNPILDGSFGFYNWGGQYGARPTVNVFDNLVVDDGTNIVEVLKPKIIILPGLGASWNTKAIVTNQVVGDNDWKMTPFVKNYNGLINALKQNGLEENKDFYVWNYDWRRPINEIESKLNSFINEKIKSDEKVILVGHSLGGLVARIWAEDNKSDSRLEKVIDLAAPNLGSVDTYEIWNGGQISNLKNTSSIAFKILLEIQGLNSKTNKDAIRKYTPVLKDLLPTFNFVSKNGKVLANDKLETYNSYLSGKNGVVGIGSTLKLFTGNGFKTSESLILKDNNIFDKVLGLWPDGRITKTNYSNSGDGTVLIKSANYSKTDFIEITSNHGDIVDKFVNQVMNEIGLSQVDVVGETQNLENNLVVFVGSPVDFSVKCDDQSPVDDMDGFVVIKNNNYKSCTVNLIGNGDGLIHVVAGNTNDNNWSYWEKNIVNGEINNIKINPNNGQIVNDKDNILFLKSIIKADINSLLALNKNDKYLKESLKNLDKNQPKKVIINIFGFRNGSNEKTISKKIIDNTTAWSSLIDKCSKNEASNGFKVVSGYQNLIDKLIGFKKGKISENAAISYQEMDEILKMTKINLDGGSYVNVCANNLAALSYGSEVLIKAYNKNDFKLWLLQDSDL